MSDGDQICEGDSPPRSSERLETAERRVQVDIQHASADWMRESPDLDAVILRAAHAAIGDDRDARAVEICVLLTDDAEQRGLNRDHRSKDASTNVLSFPAGFIPPEGPVPLGDLSLAFETVQREAAEQGKTLADHAAHLTVHGVLHLLGHDHGDDDEAEVMEAMERRILSGLGIADPYADSPLSGGRAA